MIHVQIEKKVSCPISNKKIATVVYAAARSVRAIQGTVTIFIIGDAKIRRLNKQYRGKDAPTDVLSFAWQETPGIDTNLGEIYMSYRYIARQAKRFGVSTKEEFTRMLVHGLLHIVGYDHVRAAQARKMFALQEKIVSRIDI